MHQTHAAPVIGQAIGQTLRGARPRRGRTPWPCRGVPSPPVLRQQRGSPPKCVQVPLAPSEISIPPSGILQKRTETSSSSSSISMECRRQSSRTAKNVATISLRERLPLNRLRNFATPRISRRLSTSAAFFRHGIRLCADDALKIRHRGGSLRSERSAIAAKARGRSSGSWR